MLSWRPAQAVVIQPGWVPAWYASAFSARFISNLHVNQDSYNCLAKWSLTSEVVARDEVYITIGGLTKHLPARVTYSQASAFFQKSKAVS